jgi:hypothetical protein
MDPMDASAAISTAVNLGAPLLKKGGSAAAVQKGNAAKAGGKVAIDAIAKGKSVRATAGLTAAAVGTVACASNPYTAAAAPICGIVSKVVTELIYDGIHAIHSGIRRRRKRIRRKFSDAAAKQKELDAALEESITDLVVAWKKLAPKEPALTRAQAGDLLQAAGLPIEWDVGTDQASLDACIRGQATKTTWRVPNYLSLMYDRVSYNRAAIKCTYGSRPTRKEIQSREKRTDAAMALFESKMTGAFEKAAAALINIATSRLTVRLALDQLELQRAALEANNLRNLRIRNTVITSTAVVGAAGLTWLLYKKVA